MITKSAEHVIGDCLKNLQVTYIELLEQNDECYSEVGRTLRHYVTNLAYIKSNYSDDEIEDEDEGDFDFKH